RFPRVPFLDGRDGLGGGGHRPARGLGLRQQRRGGAAQERGHPQRERQRPEPCRSAGQHYLLITASLMGGSQPATPTSRAEAPARRRKLATFDGRAQAGYYPPFEERPC